LIGQSDDQIGQWDDETIRKVDKDTKTGEPFYYFGARIIPHLVKLLFEFEAGFGMFCPDSGHRHL